VLVRSQIREREGRALPQVPDRAGGEPATDQAALLALFDVLGRRWALRVIWELGAGAMTYRDLAARAPEMSTSVLTQRLRDLRTAGLVEHEHRVGYRLTSLGRDLLAHLTPLSEWADRVAFGSEPAPD
jgi:DNA-binding HxlR family transcriptional regulator